MGQEAPGAGKEGAHVHSLLDLEEAVAGQEADLLFLRVGQVRNPLQLEVAREHRELGAREEVEAQSAHGEELAAVHSEQAVEAEVPSLGRSC